MRIWHKDLIDVLPKQQLLSQWRECCGIISNIYNKGTPNHILVNPVMDYNIGHLMYYTCMVVDEIEKRKCKVQFNSFYKFYRKFNPLLEEIPEYKELFKNWHNERYLNQCYYNLQEKFDRGGISQEEWEKIEEKYKKLINNR